MARCRPRRWMLRYSQSCSRNWSTRRVPRSLTRPRGAGPEAGNPTSRLGPARDSRRPARDWTRWLRNRRRHQHGLADSSPTRAGEVGTGRRSRYAYPLLLLGRQSAISIVPTMTPVGNSRGGSLSWAHGAPLSALACLARQRTASERLRNIGTSLCARSTGEYCPGGLVWPSNSAASLTLWAPGRIAYRTPRTRAYPGLDAHPPHGPRQRPRVRVSDFAEFE
jgi:hypothetical protein